MKPNTFVKALFSFWTWLHLACIAALLWQPSTPVFLLGRYSRNAVAVIVVLVVCLPVIYVLSKWLPSRQPFRIPPLVTLIIASTLVFSLWAAPVASATPYQIMRLYLMFIVFTLVCWSQQRRSPYNFPSAVKFARWMTFLSLATVIVAAPHYPGMLWTDEGYMVSTALGFNRTGSPIPLMWQPYESASYSLAYLGLGGWLRVTSVSLTAARYFILVLSCITVATMCVAIRVMLGEFEAWLCAIIGLLSVIHLNVLRQDILVSLYHAVALLCIVFAVRSRQSWFHFVAGFCIGFSLDGHPLAYRFILGFGLSYFLIYAIQIRSSGRLLLWRPFFSFALGGCAGVVAYISLYSTLTMTMSETINASPFFPKVRFGILGQQIEHAFRLNPLLSGIAALGGIVAVRRRNLGGLLLAFILLVGVITLTTLYPTYRSYYQAHAVALLLSLCAIALDYIPNDTYLRLASLVIVVAASMGLLFRYYDTNQDYRPAITVAREIAQIIPEGTRTTSVDPLYFVLSDYAFFEQHTIELLASQQNVSVDEAWNVVAPEVATLNYNYPMGIPPGLQTYIEENDFTCIRRWEDETIGVVELYIAPNQLTKRMEYMEC